ncbi:unnamed protein product, partial [Rotaria socialis]
MAYFLITDSITTALLILLVVTFIYYLYRARKNNIFHRLGVPGPERIPVLGEMFHVIRKHMTMHDTDLVRQYGKVVGIYEGTAPALLVTDLDLVRNVLIKDSHVFINRRGMEGIGGPLEHSLIALKDEEWKNARSIVSPTFSSAKLKAMYTLMGEVGDTYRDRLLEYADKQELFNIN